MFKSLNHGKSRTFRTYVEALAFADYREQVFQRVKGCWIPLY